MLIVTSESSGRLQSHSRREKHAAVPSHAIAALSSRASFSAPRSIAQCMPTSHVSASGQPLHGAGTSCDACSHVNSRDDVDVSAGPNHVDAIFRVLSPGRKNKNKNRVQSCDLSKRRLVPSPSVLIYTCAGDRGVVYFFARACILFPSPFSVVRPSILPTVPKIITTLFFFFFPTEQALLVCKGQSKYAL